MCQSKPAIPPAPDYAAAADAQGKANIGAAQTSASLSNPNINTPYGSQTVSYAPTGPNGDYQPTVNQTLTPEAQRTLDAQQRVQYNLAGLGEQGIQTAQNIMGSPFQYNGPGIQTSVGQGGALNYGPNAGLYGAQSGLDLSGVAKMPVNAGMTGQAAILQRLQPQIDQSQQATTQRLANQGITPGSEAYNNEMRTQGNQVNDLYSQAALQGLNLDMSANQQGYNQALGSAGLYNQAMGQNYGQALTSGQMANQAQNQGYNQMLQSAQFGNTAAQQSYAQQLAQYNQPLNEISALMGGSQIQSPQFQQYTGQNIAAAPVFNAAQDQANYAQNLYGQQMNSYNSGMSGIGGLLGAGLGAVGQAGGFAAMFSDIRLKSNIERVGTHPLGIGVYEYDIFGRRERGVMAHEVEAVMPEAVSVHPSGFKMVNYEALNV